MKKNEIVLILFLIIFVIKSESINRKKIKLNQSVWSNNLGNYKRSLVYITSDILFPFILDKKKKNFSIGFISNLDKGYIVTVRNTARHSPSIIKLKFFDGIVRHGRVIYSDPILPFGIIQIKEWDEIVSKNYRELHLGDSRGESSTHFKNTLLVNLTKDGEFSYMTGKIISQFKNYSYRYGSIMQISYENTETFIGSPVIGLDGYVIGLFIIHENNESYALNINIIKNIINQIINENSDPERKLFRGDIGIYIDLISSKIAISNFKISKEILKATNYPETNNKFMLINSIYPDSASYGILKAGDIIYKINNYVISDNLILFDEFMNHSKEKFEILVSRNGEIKKFNFAVKNVADSMTKYLYLAGGYFLDLDDVIRSKLFTDSKGVYLTYVHNNSPFAIAMENENGHYKTNRKANFIVKAINSNPISNINDMFHYFKQNCQIENFYIEGINVSRGKVNDRLKRNVVLSFNFINIQKDSMKLYSKSITSNWSPVNKFDFQDECDVLLPKFDITEAIFDQYDNEDSHYNSLEDEGIGTIQ